MELGCSLVGNRLVVSDPVSYWEYVISTNLPVICQFSLYFVINFPLILLVQGCLKEIQQMCDLNWVSRWTELCLQSSMTWCKEKFSCMGGLGACTFCKIWKFWILWDMNSSILEYTWVTFFSQTLMLESVQNYSFLSLITIHRVDTWRWSNNRRFLLCSYQ